MGPGRTWPAFNKQRVSKWACNLKNKNKKLDSEENGDEPELLLGKVTWLRIPWLHPTVSLSYAESSFPHPSLYVSTHQVFDCEVAIFCYAELTSLALAAVR